MAARCVDLEHVAVVLQQFNSFLGPELKAVTGDPTRIDNVMKQVEVLAVNTASCPYDIFNVKYQTSWETNMNSFNERVANIERAAISFIIESFEKLRSAEGAFDLLQKFKSVESRPVLSEEMQKKSRAVLSQYRKELKLVSGIFFSQKDNPPLMRNHSRVARSIAWCRSLFYRIKGPILRFKELPELLESSEGSEVTRAYLSVGREMRDYERGLIAGWVAQVKERTMERLKLNVLKIVTVKKGKAPRQEDHCFKAGRGGRCREARERCWRRCGCWCSSRWRRGHGRSQWISG